MTESPTLPPLKKGFPVDFALLIEGCLSRDRDRRPELQELGESLSTPAESKYIKKLKSLQERDRKGSEVVAVQDNGGTVWARCDASSPDPDAAYAVVRETVVRVRDERLTLEKWVADVEFRHESNGYAHFAVQGRRWVEPGIPGMPSRADVAAGKALAAIAGLGTWVDFDKHPGLPTEGDRVVPRVISYQEESERRRSR